VRLVLQDCAAHRLRHTLRPPLTPPLAAVGLVTVGKRYAINIEAEKRRFNCMQKLRFGKDAEKY